MDNLPYLFIDGGNLRAVLQKTAERYMPGKTLELDWQRVRSGARKAYYYDAIATREPGEDANTYDERTRAKRTEIAALELEEGYHVRTGELKIRRQRGESRQKMVDIQFAVDALSMATRGLFTRCMLVIGDLDFKPLVEALVDLGIDVQIYFPQGETNQLLLAAADRSLPLSVNLLWYWLKQDFAAANPLPETTQSSGLDLGLIGCNPIHEINTPRHGMVRLYRESGRPWLVQTDTMPTSPNDHLYMTSHDLRMLCCYAKDQFDLDLAGFEEVSGR